MRSSDLRTDRDVIAVNTEERDQSQILLVQSEHGLAITQRLLALLGEPRVGKVVTPRADARGRVRRPYRQHLETDDAARAAAVAG